MTDGQEPGVEAEKRELALTTRQAEIIGEAFAIMEDAARHLGRARSDFLRLATVAAEARGGFDGFEVVDVRLEGGAPALILQRGGKAGAEPMEGPGDAGGLAG
jgi:hypothetical protein